MDTPPVDAPAVKLVDECPICYQVAQHKSAVLGTLDELMPEPQRFFARAVTPWALKYAMLAHHDYKHGGPNQ